MHSDLIMFLCGLGVALIFVFVFRKQLKQRRNAFIAMMKSKNNKEKDEN